MPDPGVFARTDTPEFAGLPFALNGVVGIWWLASGGWHLVAGGPARG